MQFGDTAQRGTAATPGARVYDPQQRSKVRIHSRLAAVEIPEIAAGH
jgi:hypothetical protein